MRLPQLVSLGLSALCLLNFAWSIQRVFIWPTTLHSLTKATLALGSLFGLMQLVAIASFASEISFSWGFGIGLFCLALIVFRMAVAASVSIAPRLAFSNSRPRRIIVRGPYSLVRHPCYLAYLCYWMGGLLVSRWLPLLVGVLVMGSLYVVAAMREEREFLSGPLATQYDEYRLQTGMFWPRISLLEVKKGIVGGSKAISVTVTRIFAG